MMHVILRLPSVIDRTGLSRSTIYLMMTKNEFPSTISLGDRAVGWLEYDVNNWLEQRIEVSRKAK